MHDLLSSGHLVVIHRGHIALEWRSRKHRLGPSRITRLLTHVLSVSLRLHLVGRLGPEPVGHVVIVMMMEVLLIDPRLHLHHRYIAVTRGLHRHEHAWRPVGISVILMHLRFRCEERRLRVVMMLVMLVVKNVAHLNVRARHLSEVQVVVSSRSLFSGLVR